MTTMRNKVGPLDILKTEGIKKKWRTHVFKVSASTYLLYFKTGNMNKPDGQVLLANITKIEVNSAKGADFPFEVHFRGKPLIGHVNSPWILNANSVDDRFGWMEVIKPGSSAALKSFSARSSLGVHDREHYQQELRRLQPSPPPSYPPPQLQNPDPTPNRVVQPQASLHIASSNGRRANNFDPNKSWHGRPNVYRNSDTSTRSQSIPTQGEPEPYLEPESLMRLQRFSDDATAQGQRSGGSQDNFRATVPRNFERNGDTSRTNGEPHPLHQPVGQRSSHGFTRSSVSHDVRSPPPRLPQRSATEMEVSSPTLNLDESDDPYELMASSPVRLNEEIGASPKSTKPKPKPRSRKQPSSGSSSSPTIKLAHPPARQSTLSNEYVELCGDDGSGVTVESNPTEGGDVMSSINKLSHAMAGSMDSNDGEGVVPEELAQSFSSSQLRMLINMLQKVQAVQSPGGGNGDGGQGAGTPVSPQRTYDVTDSISLKGNFKRALSYTPNLPEEQILIIDGDDSYLPRPEWAKATGASALQIYGDTSEFHAESTLQDLDLEEALYIERDSLEDFVPIGEGQFGKVFKAVLNKRGVEPIQVAVKTAKKSSSAKEREEFEREMKIMSQMMHPNIVRLYGVVQEDKHSQWIVLEYLRNGDLKNFLTKNPRPVKQLVKYMIDISMGMHYLAEKGLVHRDLAARNILVGDNETCKVADFGLLREIPKDDSIYQMQTNVPCPVRWMPPESISQRKFSTASDVWSFGVLQWEMFNPKKTPYANFGNMEVAMKVATGYRLPVPRNIPPVVARIMKACWHTSPEKRPSFLLISTLLTTKVTFDNDDQK